MMIDWLTDTFFKERCSHLVAWGIGSLSWRKRQELSRNLLHASHPSFIRSLTIDSAVILCFGTIRPRDSLIGLVCSWDEQLVYLWTTLLLQWFWGLSEGVPLLPACATCASGLPANYPIYGTFQRKADVDAVWIDTWRSYSWAPRCHLSSLCVYYTIYCVLACIYVQ